MQKISFIEKPYSDKEILSILDEDVAKWFRRKFGKFTPAQRYAIMEIHKGENVLISSPTGSGKTLSAFLAIINELVKLRKGGKLEDRIYAIYISPLRALNNDIKRNLLRPLEGIERRVGEKLGIRVEVRTSDTTASEKSRQSRRPPHILITTPESLAIALNAPRFSKAMEGVRWVIVDEIHSLTNKRGVHLFLSLERLAARAGNFVRVGLSATVHPLEEVARLLAGSFRKAKIAKVDYRKALELRVISPVEDFIYTPAEEAHRKLYETLHQLIQEHSTVLIFTNTRSATERVVFHLKQMFPEYYKDNIEAHHSSLSREHRLSVEERLKRGELKVVVSSTSLELGIDIGSIDLVVLLGSPKSVSRALQRIGRSGHRLHEVSKGYFVVMDADDLMECSQIAKNALEGRIDSVRIPKNALDVLAQHLLGMALERKWEAKEAYKIVRRAYPYMTLSWRDFEDTLKYLAGYYDELEVRNVYSKVWYEDGYFGRRGRMARAIYYMNVGTIPDESAIAVFTRSNKFVGKIEEEFAEKLKPGDRFVLGGKVYEFVYARGAKVYVDPAEGQRPTIPAWFSEMLPLAYELALDIERARYEIGRKPPKEGIGELVKSYPMEEKGAKALMNYFMEQRSYALIPHRETLVEEFIDEDGLRNYIFHSVAGRKANDAIARIFAYIAMQKTGASVRTTISDYGFMLTVDRYKRLTKRDIESMLELDEETYKEYLKRAVRNSEMVRLRFRHIAARGLLILRRYPGRGEKSIARQQMSAEALLKLLHLYYPNFPLLKELYREVLYDAMHVDEALDYIKRMASRPLIFKEAEKVPSPFAFHLVAMGAKDVIMMEDRKKYIRELHQRLMKEMGRR